MITKNTGSGSIALLAPADITGSAGGVMRISYLSMTCSGPAVPGQSFVALKTILTAGSSTTCSTYGAGFTSTTLNLTLSLFLDDRTLDADSYPATAFTVVASAQ